LFMQVGRTTLTFFTSFHGPIRISYFPKAIICWGSCANPMAIGDTLLLLEVKDFKDPQYCRRALNDSLTEIEISL